MSDDPGEAIRIACTEHWRMTRVEVPKRFSMREDYEVTQAGWEGGMHSPDRRWWWNGTAWLPAYSPDGKHWWNGLLWISLSPPARWFDLPRWLWIVVVGWVMTVVTPWLVVMGNLPAHGVLSDSAIVSLLLIDGSATLLVGILTGFDAHPWQRMLRMTVIGSAALAIACFIWADGPVSSSTDNHGAGIAVAILLIPIVVAVMALLALGIGAGMTAKRGYILVAGR